MGFEQPDSSRTFLSALERVKEPYVLGEAQEIATSRKATPMRKGILGACAQIGRRSIY